MHAEEHRTAGRGGQERRALWVALIANAALLVIEAAGGLAFGSLVLMADAGHLLADVSALAVSVAAIGLARLATHGEAHVRLRAGRGARRAA